MKRVLLLMLLLSLALFPVFAGAATEEPAEEPEAEMVVDPDTTLVIWADEQRAPILEALGEEFTKTYGVGVTVQQLGFGDIRDNIKVAGPAGEGGDILVGAHDWLGELVTSGVVAPLDLGAKVNEFTEASVAAFTYDGQLHGLPYAVENIAFFYNADMLDSAPVDWDEVREVAIALENAGTVEYGFIRQEGDPYHFFPIQTAFGGYVFGVNPDGTYDADDVGIDNAGSLAAAKWLEDMVVDGHIPAGVDWDTYHALFETGQAAMMITGPWALDRLNTSGVNYEIAPIPGGGKPFLGVQGFMVNAFSDNKALATAFLTEFVATSDVMYEMYERDGRAPAHKAALARVSDERVSAFGEAGREGLPMPAIPEMSAVWSAWGDAVTLIMQEQVTGEEAFTNAAEQIRNTIAGN